MVVAGVIFYIILTQISFNLGWSKVQIPITGQSLAILLWAYVFGRKIALLSVGLYMVCLLYTSDAADE